MVTEGLDMLERAGPHATVPAPLFVVVTDPEVRTDVHRPLLGPPPLTRMAAAATSAGFGEVYLAPGTRAQLPGATALATGELLGRPALVVFEGSYVHPQLLDLMVAHPLNPDERYSLYDEAGRPTACFTGHLATMPSLMPMSEELPWPEGFGPKDVARLVYEEDWKRAEDLVLRGQGVVESPQRTWYQTIRLKTLQWMANSRRPIPQLELIALSLCVASLPLALLANHASLIAAAAALLLGVHASSLIPMVHSLRTAGPMRLGETDSEREAEERLCGAARPLGQAALIVGLTYVIVAETDRSGVAAVVLLVAGAAAGLLCLFQARLILRGQRADVFALPDAHAVAARLGVRWPESLDGAPFLELAVLLASLPGVAELPWAVFAVGAGARLWRWFAGGSAVSSSDTPFDGDPLTLAGRTDTKDEPGA